MITKSFEVNKINLDKNKCILLHGKNEGLKNEVTNILLRGKVEIKSYLEKEILDNRDIFIESIISRSLFENEKVIIIKRVTNKLLGLFTEIGLEDINDVFIIFNSESLEKKSKLRIFFENHQTFTCIAFYPDTTQTLSKLTYNFLREKNISISPSNINLIVSRCGGDRENLLNELKKIEYYNKNGKKITEENISKLTNLIENHSISELIDNCLAKNKKKIINILNENNFNNEDCILIIRTLLNKAKRILILSTEFYHNKNIELTISSAKPSIFWKDKEIIKQQIFKWTPQDIKQLIYKTTQMELLIKKNLNNSINLITDFVLEEASEIISNKI